MLIRQVPGLSEYETGKPFHVQGGQGTRKVFEDTGVYDFDEYVWSPAVGGDEPRQWEIGRL